jgi:predicted Fe-Mo cluster-binding NifX family protein
MRLKIAVASDDGVSISEHFGRACRFTVFEVRRGEILAEELRSGAPGAPRNAHCDTEHMLRRLFPHHGDATGVLDGCQVVLCRGMGWRAAAELVRHGINPLVIVGELSPRVAVEHYLAGTLKPAPGFCRYPNRPPAAAESTEMCP